jgi:hypothetical protein
MVVSECVITEQDRQDYVKYRSTAYLSKGYFLSVTLTYDVIVKYLGYILSIISFKNHRISISGLAGRVSTLE